MYQQSNRQTYPIIISLPPSPWHALNSEHVLTHHSNPYKVSCLRLFSDLMKCSESMKACLCSTSMFCNKDYLIGIITIQWNDKSTQLKTQYIHLSLDLYHSHGCSNKQNNTKSSRPTKDG